MSVADKLIEGTVRTQVEDEEAELLQAVPNERPFVRIRPNRLHHSLNLRRLHFGELNLVNIDARVITAADLLKPDIQKLLSPDLTRYLQP